MNYENGTSFIGARGNLRYLTTIWVVVLTARERVARGLLQPRLDVYRSLISSIRDTSHRAVGFRV